jgi:aquaporin Z
MEESLILQSDAQSVRRSPALAALSAHWPEYLMEAAELGLFMLSACVVTTLLEYPESPIHRLLPNAFLRQLLNGLAMAVTLLLLIHSRWGKRSGAHMNPALTLMFLRLKKIAAWDAAFYIFFQFAGGFAGVVAAYLLIGSGLAHPRVNFVVTEPGMWGTGMAFAAETSITFLMALTVLITSNHKKLSRLTPYFAATLLASYITFEAPLSGMSLNPARTLSSAIPAHSFHALWIYFAAPVLGMWTAGEIFQLARSKHRIFCAKYHHHNSERCIFRCRYAELNED